MLAHRECAVHGENVREARNEQARRTDERPLSGPFVSVIGDGRLRGAKLDYSSVFFAFFVTRFFGSAGAGSATFLSASAARLPRRRLAAACSRPRTPVAFGASAAPPSASRFGLYSLPISSMRAMSALSPRRGPILSRRV